MQAPSLKLQQELDKLRKAELEQAHQKVVLESNKRAAQSVLFSIQLILDRNIPISTRK